MAFENVSSFFTPGISLLCARTEAPFSGLAILTLTKAVCRTHDQPQRGGQLDDAAS